MAFTDEQTKQVTKLIAAGSYKSITSMITALDDEGNERYSSTLDAITKLFSANKLTVSNVDKLSSIYDNHRNAPITALEAAYDTLFEQLGGLESIESSQVQTQSNKAEDLAAQIENLSQEQQIITLANSLTQNEVEVELQKIKSELAPGIAMNNVDSKLVAKLELFKSALLVQTKNDDKSEESISWNHVANNNEVETLRPVLVLKGLLLVEFFHDQFVETVSKDESVSSASQILFLKDNKLVSKKLPEAKSDDLGDLPNVKLLTLRENNFKAIRNLIKEKSLIPSEDIMYTDDLQYTISPGIVLHQHRVDDRKSADLYKYIFTLDNNVKQDANFLLAVHRINDFGKLIPENYDFVQYFNASPIAMISSGMGYSALKDYDNIWATINLSSFDFSILNKKVTKPAPVVDKKATVAAPKVIAQAKEPAKKRATKATVKKKVAKTKTKDEVIKEGLAKIKKHIKKMTSKK